MTLIRQKLEAIHKDLWGQHYLISFTEIWYRVLLLDKFMQKSWVLFICSKDTFFDAFKPWLEKVEIEIQYKLEYLRIDGGEKFINLALKKFCKSKEIVLRYTSSYTHKENGLVEKC